MPKKADIDDAIDELDFSGWSALEDPTADDLADIYEGSAARGIMQVGVDANDETMSLVDENAVKFAEDRAADLVTDIAESTRDLMRGVVTQAVEEGWSTGRLASELRDSYAFSDSRAETIARTEGAFADVQGNLEGWEQSGVVEKFNVILGSEHDEDDECDDYVDGGPYELSAPAPPFHPNCVCDIVPVTTKEEEA